MKKRYKKKLSKKTKKKMIKSYLIALAITILVAALLGYIENIAIQDKIKQEQEMEEIEEMINPTNKSIVGKWRCSKNELDTIQFNADNTYIKKLKENKETGTWEFNGKKLVTYNEQNDRSIYEYSSYSIYEYDEPTLSIVQTYEIGNSSGQFYLIYKKNNINENTETNFNSIEKKENAISIDYEGYWEIDYIEKNGFIINIDDLNVNPFKFNLRISQNGDGTILIKNGISYSEKLINNEITYNKINDGIQINYILGHSAIMSVLNNGMAKITIEKETTSAIKNMTIYLKKSNENTFNKIASNNPYLGMTKNEVLNSSWGQPTKINRTVNEYRNSEQWVYRTPNSYKSRYLYFDDGILTSFQD